MLWLNASFGTDVENPVDKVDNCQFPKPLPTRGQVLGVFAKQPRVGLVKTRLTPPLSPEQARDLCRAALRETVARFSQGPAALVLCCAGRRAWFAGAFPEVPLLPQGRGDLGARLTRATAAMFAAGGGPVAVAGADSPDLPLALIAEAFAALATADAAAIPCRDGGYALLALRRPLPALFENIPWSTPAVLAVTRARAEQLGLRFVTVAPWDDLDDAAALHRLLQRSPTSATAAYLRPLLAPGG